MTPRRAFRRGYSLLLRLAPLGYRLLPTQVSILSRLRFWLSLLPVNAVNPSAGISVIRKAVNGVRRYNYGHTPR
jgi:hypothetical protein